MIELPEYHNDEQIKAAVKKQEGVIAQAVAQVNAAHATMSAIREMCDHEFTARYSCGRDAGDKCDKCGAWR
tara:strand:- start:3362 stop:3574 length:213 start_codon:yes stop_codon:yes gene_type:complete